MDGIDDKSVRMRCSGFGALLSEILGSGALERFGDADLLERTRQAVNDHERAMQRVLDEIARK